MAISNGTAQVIGQALPTPPYANESGVPPLQDNNGATNNQYRDYFQSTGAPDFSALRSIYNAFYGTQNQNAENAKNQMYANLLWNTYRNTGNNATMPVVGYQLREAIDRGNFNPILQ